MKTRVRAIAAAAASAVLLTLTSCGLGSQELTAGSVSVDVPMGWEEVEDGTGGDWALSADNTRTGSDTRIRIAPSVDPIENAPLADSLLAVAWMSGGYGEDFKADPAREVEIEGADTAYEATFTYSGPTGQTYTGFMWSMENRVDNNSAAVELVSANVDDIDVERIRDSITYDGVTSGT